MSKPTCSTVRRGPALRPMFLFFLCVFFSFLGKTGAQHNDHALESPLASPVAGGINRPDNPFKNDDVLNGVTTFDAVLIRKHVLGTEPLNSAYKIIAGDVNNNGQTTIADAVEIQKLVLNIYSEFPNNSSWRFVDASYQFPDPFNPWQEDFPECIHVDLSTQPGQANVDFVAIKIGDVNGSHDCDMFTGGGTEDRGTDFPFVLGEIQTKGYGTLEVPISVGSSQHIVAWQLGLGFDTKVLRFLGATPGDIVGMTGQNFGLTESEQGRIRALWMAPDAGPMSFDGEPAVLTLRFEKLRPFGQMSEVFWLDDSVLRCEAYEDDGTARPLHFIAPAEVVPVPIDPSRFSATVSPNPFRETFALTVNVPVASRLEVTVADRYGRQVARWEGDVEAGAHGLPFDTAHGWPDGLYHWQARTASGDVSGQVLKQ